MGNPSRQRRNRLRMTIFNLKKSNQHNNVQQNTIGNLYVQISNLKSEINILNEKLRIANSPVNVKEASSDNISQNQVPDSSSIPSKFHDISTIKPKEDLPELKQTNLESDNKTGRPLTTDELFKYMKDCHEKIIFSFGDIT